MHQTRRCIRICEEYKTKENRPFLVKVWSLRHSTLRRGSPTHGLPCCIMPPAATFVDSVYTLKITQQLRQLGIPLTIIFHLRSSNQLTITGVALCHKKVGNSWSTSFHRRENFQPAHQRRSDKNQHKCFRMY